MNALIFFIVLSALSFLAILAGAIAAFLQLGGQHQLLVLFAIAVLIYSAISEHLWNWLKAFAKDAKDNGGYHQIPLGVLVLGVVSLAYTYSRAKDILKNRFTNNCRGFCLVTLTTLVLGGIAFSLGYWEVSLVCFGLALLSGAIAAVYGAREISPRRFRHQHPSHIT